MKDLAPYLSPDTARPTNGFCGVSGNGISQALVPELRWLCVKADVAKSLAASYPDLSPEVCDFDERPGSGGHRFGPGS